jgi:GNAT superfamily N-acetyltransferase
VIRIRLARRGDLPLIQQLIRELAEYEKLEQDCTGTLEELEAALFGAAPLAQTLLAYSSDEPAGFALFFQAFSTFKARPVLYLEDLYVRPRFRGNGIGKRLFSELATIARRNKCARFEWSVLDWNEPAIRFYEKIGAEATPAWVKYQLREDRFSALAHGASEDENVPELKNRP